jgi:6-bladed beta-propeller
LSDKFTSRVAGRPIVRPRNDALLGLIVIALLLPSSLTAQDFLAKLREGNGASEKSRYPRTSLATGFEFDPTWPLAPSEGVTGQDWGEMAGLCLDHAGNILAFNRGEDPLITYDAEGHRLKRWGQGKFNHPHQVRVDHRGHVWLADDGSHVVQEYSPEGDLIRTLGVQGEPGDDERHFNQPTDMAIAPNGDIYVSDGYGNNRVVQFDAEGRFVRTWGQLGSAPGEFSLPHAIALDSKGRLYVADRNNARVQVFDLEGNFLAEWVGLLVPWHIVVTDKDEIFVCGSSPMRWPKFAIPGVPLGIPPKDQVVMVFTTEGRLSRLWAFPLGRGPGELDWLHAMAVDPKGNLYLGDIKGRRAQRFLLLAPDPSPDQSEPAERDPAVRRVEATGKPE